MVATFYTFITSDEWYLMNGIWGMVSGEDYYDPISSLEAFFQYDRYSVRGINLDR
jgi:hypothetical protein